MLFLIGLENVEKYMNLLTFLQFVEVEESYNENNKTHVFKNGNI